MDDPSAEHLLASAIQYLIQGQENDAALLLLFCDVCFTEDLDLDPFSPPKFGSVHLTLTGPRAAYDALERNAYDNWGNESELHSAVWVAFTAVIPPNTQFRGFAVRTQLVEIAPNWRQELREIAHGRGVHNQAVEIPDRKIVTWRNLRFRSESELRIARALDAVGVLFLPNCLARLSAGSERVTREADFLICHDGKWGILEVDGPFHPRAVLDHERDRLFQQHRIRVIQRFDWEECLKDAPTVVQRFLRLLEKNG